MFETFQCPALCVTSPAEQAVHSLWALGKTEGVVVECGAGVSHIVPIIESMALAGGIINAGVAGSDLTEYMRQILNERGYSFSTSADRRTAGEIKEKLAYVALDFDHEFQNRGSEVCYEMPDGQVMVISDERFRCGESLFQPGLLGRDLPGVAESTYNSIIQFDEDIQKDLCSNIVLSGGTAKLPGFAARMQKELESRLSREVKVTASPDGKFGAWIGGSIVASLSTFPQMCISKEEFEECGPSVVHRFPDYPVLGAQVAAESARSRLAAQAAEERQPPVQEAGAKRKEEQRGPVATPWRLKSAIEWSIEEVGLFLAEAALDKHVANFAAESITGKVLVSLSERPAARIEDESWRAKNNYFGTCSLLWRK